MKQRVETLTRTACRTRARRPWASSTAVVALLLAASLLAASCGGESGAGLKGKREVAIAFVGARTGDNAALGLNFRDGVRMAIDEENGDGDRDLTIRLREFDTSGDPARARAVKGQFLTDRTILGLVGPVFTGETNELIPELQQAGLVTISASAVEKSLPSAASSRTVFHRIVATDHVQSSGIAEYLSSVERPTSVAYVHDGSEYGKQLALATERKTAARGVRTATIVTLDPQSPGGTTPGGTTPGGTTPRPKPTDPTATDLAATVTRVRASGADAVFYGGRFTEAALLKTKLFEQGASVNFISGDGALDQRFGDSTQAVNAGGVRLTCACNFPLETSTGRLKKFFDDYRQRIGREPGLYSAEGYDAASILIRGIKAGNEDREKLLRHVEEMGRYEGISKSIEFAADGNLKANTFVIYEVRSGRIATLRTLNLTEGSATAGTTGAPSTTSTIRRTTTTRRPTTSSTITTLPSTTTMPLGVP